MFHGIDCLEMMIQKIPSIAMNILESERLNESHDPCRSVQVKNLNRTDQLQIQEFKCVFGRLELVILPLNKKNIRFV